MYVKLIHFMLFIAQLLLYIFNLLFQQNFFHPPRPVIAKDKIPKQSHKFPPLTFFFTKISAIIYLNLRGMITKALFSVGQMFTGMLY